MRSYWTAALDTIACGPPWRPAAAISPSTWAASETSQTCASARPPPSSMAAATARTPSPATSAHSTTAPSAASRSAIARPIPVAAPVTTLTLPCIRTSVLLRRVAASSATLTIK